MAVRPHNATIVLDIGKTNVKLALIDTAGQTLTEQRIPNTVLQDGPYPHADVERIWDWMLATFREFAQQAEVGAIVPVTHGATAALVDDHGLVLPVQDYEFDFKLDDYSARPDYRESCSPALPMGLNLGRQIAWQARSFPTEFAKAKHILMYPQYWAWRLSGVAVSEVTSLGCHTDLWNSTRQRYSSMVEKLDWNTLFPPMSKAWDKLGPIKPELAELTGLPRDCQIVSGIHDSNASLLRYLDSDGSSSERVVLSTGTWMIAAAFGAPLDRLVEARDMLANTNALGKPVACMRFMGGREFGTLAGPDIRTCDEAQLARTIAQGTLALPSFAETGGPFSGQVGRIEGQAPTTPEEKYALATLYVVLVTDYCLSALGTTAPVVVEGSFTANPYFAPLLAALRPGQAISVSDDTSGTTAGGWMLHHWGSTPAVGGTVAAPLQLEGLQTYQQAWTARLN
jgi:sugar (pentulose or hexulose) kinase